MKLLIGITQFQFSTTYILCLLASHEWATLVENVQMYIKSLNWGYRVALKDATVTYLNEYARFVDKHTIEVCKTFK